MSDTYYTIEARILTAIEAIRDEYFANCTKAATAYQLPARTLQRR